MLDIKGLDVETRLALVTTACVLKIISVDVWTRLAHVTTLAENHIRAQRDHFHLSSGAGTVTRASGTVRVHTPSDCALWHLSFSTSNTRLRTDLRWSVGSARGKPTFNVLLQIDEMLHREPR